MSKTISWGTDLHLDMADNEAYEKLIDSFKKQKPDMLIITGDTSEKMTCFDKLVEIQKSLNVPLYYILGNHDCYGSTIQGTKDAAKKYSTIQWLTDGKIIALNETTALVGHDGWADGKTGNFEKLPLLPDFSSIEDFSGFGKPQWKKIMQNFGERSALESENTLLKAFEKFSSVIFITHAPPFREACMYEGKATDDNWAPLFVNTSLGKMLFELMENYPDKNLHLYCGHTHHKCEYSPLPNFKVTVAHADYGKPEAQKPIII